MIFHKFFGFKFGLKIDLHRLSDELKSLGKFFWGSKDKNERDFLFQVKSLITSDFDSESSSFPALLHFNFYPKISKSNNYSRDRGQFEAKFI